MKYYAHSIEDYPKEDWQLLVNHLHNVSDKASIFAKTFRAEELARIIGLLHDTGKYSLAFQKRIERKGQGEKVDHSTAGGQLAVSMYGELLGKLMAYCICGHHRGLPDGGPISEQTSLYARLEKSDIPDYSAWAEELILGDSPNFSLASDTDAAKKGFTLAFYIRMLYSCLVDADFLDTELFMNPVQAGNRPELCHPSLILKRLNAFLHQYDNAAKTSINLLRADIQNNCHHKAMSSPGLFSLTVPTGGGKTLSSLVFALTHAVKNGMDRVIYVIPFTSIIEQNAQVFRDAVGNEFVLEHHSNYQGPGEKDDSSRKWWELASENWDMPLVVTTSVQFFESLFSNRSSQCRKLHNIVNSVVIFDEAQSLPTPLLKPCLAALVELVKRYGSTVILCTATQPALQMLLPHDLQPSEIMPDPQGLYEAFRRITVIHKGEMKDDELTKTIKEQSQVLCIVNTRGHADRLYDGIRDIEGAYHLSARMCPVHRSYMLDKIKKNLDEKNSCRVISTQLIEAGVDIDFPVVYRAIAGIDSIAQAAGRCNREGKLDSGMVYVFDPEKHGLPGGWFSKTAEIARIVMREHDDPLSLAAIQMYFSKLYGLEGDALDEMHILADFQEKHSRLNYPFESVAKQFRFIDNNTYPIVIPWKAPGAEGESPCAEAVEQIRMGKRGRRVLRRLQPYTVQIYEREYLELMQSGYIKPLAEGIDLYVLENQTLYDQQRGVVVDEQHWLNDTLIK